MKRLLTLLLCLLLILCSCASDIGSASSSSESSSKSSQAPSTEEPSSDSSTIEPSDKLDDRLPIAPNSSGVIVSRASKVKCYPTLPVRLILRDGISLSDKNSASNGDGYGNSYFIIKSYERLAELFENANWVDKEIFDTYDLLMVSQRYGGMYSVPFGFSDLSVDDDGTVRIIFHNYSGNGWAYNDAEYGATTCLLVPKGLPIAESDTFKPLNLQWASVICDSFYFIKKEAPWLTLEQTLFLNAEEFEAINSEHELKYNIPEGDSAYYLVFPADLNYRSLFESTITLNGDTLDVRLKISSRCLEPAGICVLRISEPALTKKPEAIRLSFLDYTSSSYQSKLSEDDWDNAIDTTIASKMHISDHYIINNPSTLDYHLFRARTIEYHKPTSSLVLSQRTYYGHSVYDTYYYGCFQDTSTLVASKNELWHAPTEGEQIYGVSDKIDLSLLKGQLKNASYGASYYDNGRYIHGLYKIEQIGNYRNIYVKIANGAIAFVAYESNYNEESGKYESSHSIKYTDYWQADFDTPFLGEELDYSPLIR